MTDTQQRLLSEFVNKDLFISDLLRMPNLKDIKSIESKIRDFYQYGYLTRIRVLNPLSSGKIQ